VESRTSASDEELVESWRAGDRSAGDQLFVRHFDSVFRFFAGKIHGDVEDLVQTTFMACVEGKEAYRGESSFRTYMFAVARRLLYRHWRTRSRRPQIDFAVTSLEDLGPSPSAAVRGREEQRLLLEALRRIPLQQQIALELHYWEQLSGKEIALVLDIPEGTVRSRLRLARAALEEQLCKLGSDPELLESTLGNLERWAESFRQLSARRHGEDGTP
jgi:RNA polymerase sigma-70 factor (ECF subfamily)